MIFNPKSSAQNIVFSLAKCVCILVAISKEPFCSLSCSFLCDAAVVMETDLGVALLSRVRDSLIWSYCRSLSTRSLYSVLCFDAYSTELRWNSVFGANTRDILSTPPKYKSGSSATGALKSRQWHVQSYFRWGDTSWVRTGHSYVPS